MGENLGQTLYCGFHRKKWTRQGKQLSRFRLDSLNTFGGFGIQGLSTWPWSDLRQEEYWLGV